MTGGIYSFPIPEIVPESDHQSWRYLRLADTEHAKEAGAARIATSLIKEAEDLSPEVYRAATLTGVDR